MGIDPSLTKFGVIALDQSGDIVLNRVIKSSPEEVMMLPQRMKRIHDIISQMKEACDSTKPELICVEHYIIGMKSKGTTDRIELGGLLRYVLWREGYRVVEVNQSTLKKHATGKGQRPDAGKTPVIVALTHRYGVQFATDDEYDAYGLARMALQIAGFDQPINQSQRDDIAKVLANPVKKPRKARKG